MIKRLRVLSEFATTFALVLFTTLPLFAEPLAAAAPCQLVELQVGYPGFQGFVTGVDGVGDHACVEDLEDEDSFFNRRKEDRANRRAAKSVEISGTSDVWTWENWLVIEVERGLLPTCYSCAFAEANERKEPRGTDVEWDDPRLACGELGSSMLMQQWKNDHEIYAGFTMGDYELRAIAMLSTRDGYINAEEMIDLQEEVMEEIFASTGGNYLDVRWMWDELIERGAAFRVPEGVHPDDQYVLLLMGMLSMTSYAGSDNMETLYRLTENAYYDWLQDGSRMPWKDYLAAIDADEWF